MPHFKNSILNEIYDRMVDLDAKLSGPENPPIEVKELKGYSCGVSNNSAHLGDPYVWLDKALTGLVQFVSMDGKQCIPRKSLYEGREVWYGKGGKIVVTLKDGTVYESKESTDPPPVTGTLDYHHITPEARLSGKPGIAIVNCYNPRVIWKSVSMGGVKFSKHQDDHGRQVFTAYGNPNLTGPLTVKDAAGKECTTIVTATGNTRQKGPCWSH